MSTEGSQRDGERRRGGERSREKGEVGGERVGEIGEGGRDRERAREKNKKETGVNAKGRGLRGQETVRTRSKKAGNDRDTERDNLVNSPPASRA